MKKWSLALILSMAILAGCGSTQSPAQTTEANVEVKDNRTETEKSGGSGSTVVDNRQKKQITAYEPFDTVELYLTGRKGGF